VDNPVELPAVRGRRAQGIVGQGRATARFASPHSSLKIVRRTIFFAGAKRSFAAQNRPLDDFVCWRKARLTR
jgi:hypothetical protein